jgi:hypothetical protein
MLFAYCNGVKPFCISQYNVKSLNFCNVLFLSIDWRDTLGNLAADDSCKFQRLAIIMLEPCGKRSSLCMPRSVSRDRLFCRLGRLAKGDP